LDFFQHLAGFMPKHPQYLLAIAHCVKPHLLWAHIPLEWLCPVVCSSESHESQGKGVHFKVYLN